MWWYSHEQVCLNCRDCWRYINHCVRGSNIASACGCGCLVKVHGLMWTQHLSIPHLSDVQLRCDALHYCPTMVGNRDVPIRRFHNFPPHRIQRLASAIMSLSPIILHSHLPKKTFRCAFHPHTSPCQRFSVMVTSQSSDRASLKWLRQRYTTRTVSDYGSLPGREIADMRQDTI